MASSHDGNLATQVLDGDFKTRWSANGKNQTLTFDYGQDISFDAVKVAFHKGDQRQTRFSIEASQDGISWNTVLRDVESTGKSSNLERFDFPQVTARFIKYVGMGNSKNDWNSVTEFLGVNCKVDYCSNQELPRKEILVPVKITSSSHDGNTPDRLFDNDIKTRWSANGLGEWAMYDYGNVQKFDAVRLAFHKGNQRKSNFDIQVSTDGNNWQTILEGETSSGGVNGYERFSFEPVKARYIRYVGQGNTKNAWSSVTEFAGLNCDINRCPDNHIITDEVIKAEQIAIEKNKKSGTSAKSQEQLMKELRSGDFGVKVALPCATNCDWDVPLRTPTIPLAPLANNKPGENFDLTTWYLSQPFDHDKNGKPDDVQEWDLANGYEHPEIFYTADDGGLVFKTYIKGVRTSKNTKFARTELREMLRAGDKSIPTKGVNKNNWVFSSAPIEDQKAAGGVDGILEATLKIDHTTTTGELGEVGRFIIGQIHDQDDEPIRLYYRKLPNRDTGTVYFAHENTLKGTDNYFDLVGGMTGESEDGIALGEVFSYRIEVVGNTLTVTIKRDGKPDVTQFVDMSESGYDVGGKYMYFKAGVYNQNISGDPDDYVQATFYKLKKSHNQYVQ
ncbi:polysaccharide lyase family 7 protein [Vibrio algarum]|uniref:Polysaccharide lyase family 7 protein n=1 Tax=Vibrio algarum TaxID=3020714 RepID=A0ABT4YR21_9VIBR|nr:polysaccharide lyase family 7 protein [Vibrio sp. KJ40-1]MDB1124002.1 polysaccharide lyase family 7 protein [Vibrio sp. KJ40-1]